MDAADGFQMVPEFVAQNAAQKLAGFCKVCLRVCLVKRALEQLDLPDAVGNMILPHGIEVVRLGIVGDHQSFRHDHAAGQLPKKLLRKLIQQLLNHAFVFLKADHIIHAGTAPAGRSIVILCRVSSSKKA